LSREKRQLGLSAAKSGSAAIFVEVLDLAEVSARGSAAVAICKANPDFAALNPGYRGY
jgi:hypothetical protein